MSFVHAATVLLALCQSEKYSKHSEMVCHPFGVSFGSENVYFLNLRIVWRDVKVDVFISLRKLSFP